MRTEAFNRDAGILSEYIKGLPLSQEDLEAFMAIGTPNAKKTGPRAASK